MNFEFLNSIVPVAMPEKEVKPKGKVKQVLIPEGLTLRLMKDGRVFPSKELVEQFGLEYNNKNSEEVSYGFDILKSSDWSQYPSGEGVPNFVFIAKVDKNEAKVDLFGSVDYNTDGSPKKSVLNQGSKRPELIEKIREVYDLGFHSVWNVEGTEVLYTNDLLFGSNNYVDLEIKQEVVVFPNLDAYYIPKSVKKGSKAGTMSYETRKGLVVNPLVIKQ